MLPYALLDYSSGVVLGRSASAHAAVSADVQMHAQRDVVTCKGRSVWQMRGWMTDVDDLEDPGTVPADFLDALGSMSEYLEFLPLRLQGD